MTYADRARERRSRRRTIVGDALLALLVALSLLIALLVFIGARPFDELGPGAGIAGPAPRDEVLRLLGVKNRDDNATDRPPVGDIGVRAADGQPSFPSGFATAASARLGSVAGPVLVARVTGTTPQGESFRGTISIGQFVVSDGKLFVIGTVSGTIRDAAGNVLETVENLPVRLPVTVTYVDGELTIELGALVLPELGVRIELDPLVPDAGDLTGRAAEALLEQVRTIADLVAAGAPAAAVAGELNAFVALAGGTRETAAQGSVPGGAGSGVAGSAPSGSSGGATPSSPPPPPPSVTSVTTTTIPTVTSPAVGNSVNPLPPGLLKPKGGLTP